MFGIGSLLFVGIKLGSLRPAACLSVCLSGLPLELESTRKHIVDHRSRSLSVSLSLSLSLLLALEVESDKAPREWLA